MLDYLEIGNLLLRKWQTIGIIGGITLVTTGHYLSRWESPS